MLKSRYPETDMVIFADLNVDFEYSQGKKFFDKLDHNSWYPLFPSTPTRAGAGQQRDSKIDYFITSKRLAQDSSLSLAVRPFGFQSDHSPLIL
jgi:hypothetical protein